MVKPFLAPNAPWLVLTGCAAALLAVTLGFARLSYGLLVPALQGTFGGTVTEYGSIGTLNFAGYLMGTLALPLLLPFVQPARLNLVSGVLLGLSLGASALSPNVNTLAGWRFLIGALSAPTTVLALTLTLERVPAAMRGRVSGVVWGGGAGGIALSGGVVPLVLDGPQESWRWTWLAMGASGLIAASCFSLFLEASPPRSAQVSPTYSGGHQESLPRATRHRVWQVMQPRQQLLLLLAYTCFGAGYIVYFTYIVSVLAERDTPATTTGWIWAALGVSGMASGVIWGWAIDRWPSGWTLASALGLGAVGAGLALSGNPLVVGVGAGVVGLTVFVGPPLMVTALLRREVPSELYARCLSLATALFAGGQIFGPLLGAWAVQSRGLSATVGLSAALLCSAALFACGFSWSRKRPSIIADP